MKNLRLALLCLAAIAALFLGAGFLERGFRDDQTVALVPADHAQPLEPPSASGVATDIAKTQTPPADTPERVNARHAIESVIAQAPDYVRFFDRMRLVFPSDYDTILRGLAQASLTAQKPPVPDAIMADAVAALRKAEGGLAAKASDAALAQIFVMQLREMQALAQRDVHLCVAFLYGVNGNGFLDFAADHRGLIADAAIAGLDAMNSGRTETTARAAPGDPDFQILDKALTQKGLSRPEIEALLDGKNPDPPIGDDRMCVAGQTYLDTLSTLDPRARNRLYGLAVDLMAKS